ncbi:hypothetical protein NKJ50_33410 [Mesorhizobium sp. M0115]|uniref:hypothetical protein n=1 Tax=Mesorhizobium sp. M0115 TaxID=2956883 RepID=UPI00333B11F4
MVSSFGLNPRVHQSGLGAAHHGRISKAGRSTARAFGGGGLGSGESAGPLTLSSSRLRARRGHQGGSRCRGKKADGLCWCMLTEGKDYFWGRPSHKTRSME